MLTLRPYQAQTLHAVHVAESRGIRRPLIVLPTGTGKTIVFAYLLSQRAGRSLVLVHRDELIHQAHAKLKEISPALSIGIVKAERDEHDAPCVIGSVATLARESRLHHLIPDFRTIIVDEAHHAVAGSYRRILEHCGVFAEDGPLCLGVTATPQRGDNVGLDAVFQEIIYKKTILEMILAGYVSDVRAIQVTLKADFQGLHTRAGDFIDREVEGLLLDADAPALILRAYLEHARGRKALLFTPTVKLAHLMAEDFQAAGVAAEALDGSTPTDARRAILKRFTIGETRVLANCGVLTEGYDEPSVDCVVIARPTKSTSLFTQMVGRGTRLYPGKVDCLVIDVAGVDGRHDLASVASLTGLPLSALPHGASVAEAAAEIAAVQERAQRRGRVVARAVDLFRQRALHWLSSDRSFVLSLGEQGWLVLSLQEVDPERWSVLVVDASGHMEESHAGLSLPYAQGIAEDYARRVGAGGLVNPRAHWRQRPASDKQRWALRTLHIDHQQEITMGEASDLLSVAKLRRMIRTREAHSALLPPNGAGGRRP